MALCLFGSFPGVIVNAVVWIVVVLFFVAVSAWPAGMLLIIWAAKKEVNNTPRVPMLNCDKHGLYPESAAFTITASALGREDLPVKICPFCYDDNMRRSEQILKEKDNK